MRVLIFGGNGRFGIRLLPALVSAGHHPIAFVRNKHKLESSLPPDLLGKVSIIQGDAEELPDLKQALIQSKCDVFVNCAGSPSSRDGKGPKSNQGIIGMRIIDACLELNASGFKPLRGWFVMGLVFLDDPQGGGVLHDRCPNFRPEHRPTFDRLRKISTDQIQWTVLCPSLMFQSSPNVSSPYMIPRPGAQEIVLLKEQTSAPWWIWGISSLFRPLGALSELMKALHLVPIVLWHSVRMEDLVDAMVPVLGEKDLIGKRVGCRRETIWERWGLVTRPA